MAKEPMIIMLLAASFIYFISGDTGDGIFLASAIIPLPAISWYQKSRSHHAIWYEVIKLGKTIKAH